MIFLGLGLVGCAPTHNFTVPELPPSQHQLNADLKDIQVVYQQKEKIEPSVIILTEKFSPEDYTSYLDLAWGAALVDALKRATLFDKSAAKKVSINVNILDVQTPPIGLSFTTTVSANYKITDRATDKIIYSKIIRTEATVPLDYAFVGAKRADESRNRSVQNNILAFIDSLKALKGL